MERLQWQIKDEEITQQEKEKIAGEIADIFIYSLLLSHDLGIDLVEAATKIVEKNNEKYPLRRQKDQPRNMWSSRKFHKSTIAFSSQNPDPRKIFSN